jgi:hypothetical protein
VCPAIFDGPISIPPTVSSDASRRSPLALMGAFPSRTSWTNQRSLPLSVFQPTPQYFLLNGRAAASNWSFRRSASLTGMFQPRSIWNEWACASHRSMPSCSVTLNIHLSHSTRTKSGRVAWRRIQWQRNDESRALLVRHSCLRPGPVTRLAELQCYV